LRSATESAKAKAGRAHAALDARRARKRADRKAKAAAAAAAVAVTAAAAAAAVATPAGAANAGAPVAAAAATAHAAAAGGLSGGEATEAGVPVTSAQAPVPRGLWGRFRGRKKEAGGRGEKAEKGGGDDDDSIKSSAEGGDEEEERRRERCPISKGLLSNFVSSRCVRLIDRLVLILTLGHYWYALFFPSSSLAAFHLSLFRYFIMLYSFLATPRFRRMKHPIYWCGLNVGITVACVWLLAWRYTRFLCERRTEFINAGRIFGAELHGRGWDPPPEIDHLVSVRKAANGRKFTFLSAHGNYDFMVKSNYRVCASAMPQLRCECEEESGSGCSMDPKLGQLYDWTFRQEENGCRNRRFVFRFYFMCI
jgi:hypothetical protein